MEKKTELRERLLANMDSLAKEAVETSHFIHSNPEPGCEEFKAAARLTDDLAKHGFIVEKPVGGMETAFKAHVSGKSPGPRIAFLAEYDSLGLLGHACGHNFIGTVSTFAGIALQPLMGELDGAIMVIGTPAEETWGGKIVLLENGVFKDVDTAMMIHPSNETRMQAHSLAAQVVEFTFHGKPAHAAAMPWQGINALDALIQMFISVDQMRKQQRPTVRTPGIIKYGGERANVVPERAVGQFSCRGEDYEELLEVIRRVNNCADGAALATGTKVESKFVGPLYKDMIPNQTLVKLYEKNFLSIGGVIEENPHKGQGSLDMGNLSHEFPCIHPYIRIAPNDVSIHTAEFRDCAACPMADERLLLGAKTLALTALDILLEPALLEEMRKELKKK